MIQIGEKQRLIHKRGAFVSIEKENKDAPDLRTLIDDLVGKDCKSIRYDSNTERVELAQELAKH